MTGSRFIEDELPRPFTGTLAWTSDGRGVQVCVEAQAMYIGARAEGDRIIRMRLANTGVRFKRVRCRHCGGWHLEREP
jgi:hypothetical protein